VRVLAHPVGRILLGAPRPAPDVPQVLDACRRHGVAVELSGDPHRLDLPEAWHGEARRLGLLAAVAADSYDLAGIDQAILAVGSARRGGWRKGEVISAMDTDEFLAWCRG
jgi:DNA polymerase (family 10)